MNNMTPALQAIIDRIEAVMSEMDDRKDDLREVYAQAKSDGFNVQAIRAVVKERRETVAAANKRRQTEEDADLYRHALGMLADTPLGEAAIERRQSAPTPPEPRRRGRPAGSKNRPKNPDQLLAEKVNRAFAPIEGVTVSLVPHPSTDIVDRISSNFFPSSAESDES